MPEHEDITGVGNLHESKAKLYDSSGNELISADGSEYWIKEQAAAEVDRAGYGQYWVKNDTPNVPYFTDDAGTDHNLLTGGGIADVVDDTTPQLGGHLDGQGFDLNNLGVVFLTEQAAAEADVAGKGQIWVKNTTPNELWFTDDAGTDVQLGVAGGGGASTALDNLASVAINTSLISDTSATDDLGSSSIPWKRLYLKSGATTDDLLNIEMILSQSGDPITVTASTGTEVFRVNPNGHIRMRNGSNVEVWWMHTDYGILSTDSSAWFRCGSGGQFSFDSNASAANLTPDCGLGRGAAGVVKVTNGSTGAGALQFQEMTAPTAPATNNCILFSEDNGSGKTRLVVRFPTGADVVLATEA